MFGGKNTNYLRYADDTVIITESVEKLQSTVNAIVIESNYVLPINSKKTGCMVITKTKVIPTCDMTFDGQQIHQIDSFNYLGSTIISNGCSDGDIEKIAMAKKSLINISNIRKNEHISMTIRIRTLNCNTTIWTWWLEHQ